MATIKKLKLGGQPYPIEDESARSDISTLQGYFTDKSSQLATTTAHGFMSSTDKTKLDGIKAATTTTLGLVQVGSGLDITDAGILSVQAGDLPIASATALGAIKVGNTLSIDSSTGVLNAIGYDLPIASTTALGGVKIADTSSSIAVNGTTGIISVVDNGHAHTIDNVTNLQTALDNKLETSLKGAASGLAELDSTGKVPVAQLPSYVSDVVEGYYDATAGKFYKDAAKTEEITPETNKIYVDLITNKTYRWGGTTYVEISASLALGETETTAYRGDKGKEAYERSQVAYDHSQVTDSNPHATKFADIIDNIATKYDESTGDGKLGGIKVGANLSITVDGVLSGSYANATTSAAGLMSDTDKTKLDGIEAGANKTGIAKTDTLGAIKVGSGLAITDDGILSVQATGLPIASDTTLGAIKVGTNLSINTEGELSATDTTYAEATSTASGLMSKEDYTRLKDVEAGANKYVLPTASDAVLGGVKVDSTSNIAINAGVISTLFKFDEATGTLDLGNVTPA